MKLRKQTTRLAPELLEDRCVPTAFVGNGYLYVLGTNGNDTAVVEQVGRSLKVTDNGRVSYFARSSVSKGTVLYYGRDGDDSFRHSTLLASHVFGMAGNDSLVGGAGRDHLDGGDGDDRLCGGAGDDVIYGRAGTDLLLGEGGNDMLLGGTGDDEIWGGDGNDHLRGEGGLDFLLGGDGDDYLDGGTDGGVAWGGSGADRFVRLPPSWIAIVVLSPYGSVWGSPGGIQDFSPEQGDTRDAASDWDLGGLSGGRDSNP